SAAVRASLSPAASAVDRTLKLDVPRDPRTGPSSPLSLDPAATVWALSVATATLLTFWSARQVFSRHTPRHILRGIAAAGLAAAALALVQHSTSPTLLYWTFRPLDRGATPYTPFVNRNDLATWLMMAVPLTIGYAVARLHSAHRRANGADLE